MRTEIAPEIIRRIVEGETELFDQVIEAYKGLVFGTVRRYVPLDSVDEVSHEAFINIFRGLESYRGGGPFSFWIKSVATRTCYSFWRTARRRGRLEGAGLDEDEAVEQISAEAVENFYRAEEREKAKEMLRTVLLQLSPDEKMIFSLMMVEGKPVNEVAFALNLSTVNVRVKSHRIKAKLKKLIKAFDSA